MDKRKEKSFIRMNTIICLITMLIIGIVNYLMKDMEWWQVMISLFAIVICSSVVNSLNIVFHMRKK